MSIKALGIRYSLLGYAGVLISYLDARLSHCCDKNTLLKRLGLGFTLRDSPSWWGGRGYRRVRPLGDGMQDGKQGEMDAGARSLPPLYSV